MAGPWMAMHFPRFWNRARVGQATAWGWSDQSADEARSEAEKRLGRILQWLAGETPDLNRYAYGDRPLREEVLREFRQPDGQLEAAVTRNRQGCLVLNTATALFVDIDQPLPPPAGLMGMFRKRKPAHDSAAFEECVNLAIGRWLAAHPGWAWRAYRTKAGIRLLATHAPVAVDHPGVVEAFQAMGADPLYRQLCLVQKSFRARLTPKPWRCKAGQPPAIWPWLSGRAEERFRLWEKDYLERASRFATCRLLDHHGAPAIHPELAELVAFHDQVTRVDSGLPLA